MRPRAGLLVAVGDVPIARCRGVAIDARTTASARALADWDAAESSDGSGLPVSPTWVAQPRNALKGLKAGCRANWPASWADVLLPLEATRRGWWSVLRIEERPPPPHLFVWVFVYKPNTQTNTLLPARSRSLALHLTRGRGVPASPLRSKPGTPFLDPTHHRCSGRGQMQSGSGSERAAASRGSSVTTKEWSEKEDDRWGSGGWRGNCGW